MTLEVGFAEDLGVDARKIMDFYSAHWARPIALSDQEFHYWQFVMPPSNGARNTCVVAVRNGVLLGVMGLNKRGAYISDKILNGAELTTWVVEGSIKGSTVGAKILQFITDRFDFLIGMGITQDALSIYLRSGFRYLRYIPRFICVLDMQKILEISTHSEFAKKIIQRKIEASSHIEYLRVKWNEVNVEPKVEGNHFSRKLSDLVWRYDNHPYYDYLTFKILSPDSSAQDGYVVLRSEVTKDVKILHVVDIFGDESTYERSIDFIENFAVANEYWAVDMYSTYSELNKYFLKRGWLSAVDNSFINIPHLYHPLEVRNPATTSLIYWSKDRILESYDISKLYLTKQDADLDRPTMHYIENSK